MNQKQKRALNKKRRAQQKQRKQLASIVRFERSLVCLNASCPAVRDGVRCLVEVEHNVHRGVNANNFVVVWRDSERA